MKPRRILLASHDAGGAVRPMLAIAEAFVSRDHYVVWLGQPSIAQRAEASGCYFSPYPGIANYQDRIAMEEQQPLSARIITGAETGEHLLTMTAEHDIELIVVDANLAGAAAAAESLDQPSAILLHSMYATFTQAWFAEFWPSIASDVNRTRRRFALAACNNWASVFAGHDRLISAVPRSFDLPVREVPSEIRHFGFLVPEGHARSSTSSTNKPSRDLPFVVVGLSTTYQRQEHLLKSILEALGLLRVRGVASTSRQVDAGTLETPRNVAVHEFVDHDLLLSHADVMVTHAGLGSIAAALSRGVPLVCCPLGRDQYLNAERVTYHGAGISLTGSIEPFQIAAAVQEVLDDQRYRDAARQIAEISRQAGGQIAAVEELECLLC